MARGGGDRWDSAVSRKARALVKKRFTPLGRQPPNRAGEMWGRRSTERGVHRKKGKKAKRSHFLVMPPITGGGTWKGGPPANPRVTESGKPRRAGEEKRKRPLKTKRTKGGGRNPSQNSWGKKKTGKAGSGGAVDKKPAIRRGRTTKKKNCRLKSPAPTPVRIERGSDRV